MRLGRIGANEPGVRTLAACLILAAFVGGPSAVARGTAAAPQASSSRTCPINSGPDFPSIGALNASGLSCRVARGVAREIQHYWKRHQSLPARIHRRYSFSCRYREAQGEFNPYMKANCVRVNHPKQRVRANLGS